MISDEFSEELQAAIEVALDGTGLRPSWVMKYIVPVIEKFTAQQNAPLCRWCNRPEADHKTTDRHKFLAELR